MFHVALLSRWHPHTVRYVPELQQSDDCDIACVWDEDAARGRAWAEELNVPFTPSLQRVMDDPEVDAVCVTAPTAMHKEILLAAARAGKHVFTEKNLAMNAREADEIRAAVVGSGVRFGVAFVQRSCADYLLLKRLLSLGTLGEISMLRIRNSMPSGVNGRLETVLPYWLDIAQTGGGSNVDLGCHQAYLFDWLLGRPQEVNATFAHSLGRAGEDSAACTFLMNGARTIAVMETSYMAFTYPPPAYKTEVYGSRGTFLSRMDRDEIEIQVDRRAPMDVLAAFGDGVRRVDAEDSSVCFVQRSALPTLPSPLRLFIDACLYGREIPYTIDDAVRMTKILDGANIAWREKRTYRYAWDDASEEGSR